MIGLCLLKFRGFGFLVIVIQKSGHICSLEKFFTVSCLGGDAANCRFGSKIFSFAVNALAKLIVFVNDKSIT